MTPLVQQWGAYTGRHKQMIFTGRSGIQVDITQDIHPVDIYNMFLSQNLLECIALETNTYATQILQEKTLTRSSRLHKWHDIGPDDLKIFFGIIIWMELNNRPSLRDYWSHSPLYENQVVELMPRNKFELIMRMLYFSNNRTAIEGGRLAKLRPMIDILHTNFQSVYTIGEEMVIDETMGPWRGRLSFRQYIPGKKHKYGVKLFKICSTEGYTWKLRFIQELFKEHKLD